MLWKFSVFFEIFLNFLELNLICKAFRHIFRTLVLSCVVFQYISKIFLKNFRSLEICSMVSKSYLEFIIFPSTKKKMKPPSKPPLRVRDKMCFKF